MIEEPIVSAIGTLEAGESGGEIAAVVDDLPER